MKNNGLTKPQLETLEIIGKDPKFRYFSLRYRPAQTLVKLGFAKWEGARAFDSTALLEITDAGRAALAETPQ